MSIYQLYERVLHWVSIFVLVVLLVFGIIVLRDIFGHRTSPEEKTYREFWNFDRALNHFVFDGGVIPEGDLKSVVTAMESHARRSMTKQGVIFSDECPSIRRGIDLWGNQMQFAYDKEKNTAIILSAGRNGRDEDGKGDDIRRVIELPVPQKMESN